MLRRVTGQVDAVLVSHHPHRVRVQRLGMAAGAVRLDRPTGTSLAPVPRPSGIERCSRCTGTTPSAAVPGARRSLSIDAASGETKTGVKRPAGGGHQFTDTGQIDRVVSVPAIGRAASRRHQTGIPQLAEVIRNQVLRLTDQSSSAPCTMRSLRASSLNSRQRSGCPASCRNSGGARSGACFGCIHASARPATLRGRPTARSPR